MKSLSSSVNNFLHNWKDFSGAADKITSSEAQFPIQISGTHGSLFTYFLNELSTAANAKNEMRQSNGAYTVNGTFSEASGERGLEQC